MNQSDFNKTFRTRTKNLAIEVIKFYSSITNKNEANRIIGRQLMRSATSVGANFRAACVSRSHRERFAKMSIVVEESDETLYWLELMEEVNNNIVIPSYIKQEALEITKVMSVSRNKIKHYL